jgi:hypothetical protein
MSGEVPTDQGGDELALLRTRNEQLEVRLRDVQQAADKKLVQLELKAEAIKSGMVDLDGLKLVEPSEVSIDDQGQVRGAAALMGRLRRDKPWLFGAASSSSSAGVPAHTPSRVKLATEMTLDEWRAARAELLRRR